MSPTDADALVILATAPDEVLAQRLARDLVEARLAACVGCLPGLHSVYRWEGEVETAREVQLLIKTVRARLPALRAAYEAAHPYDVPEFLVLPVAEGGAAYLRWMRDATALAG
ncbi:MAG: divalent-cation tolerance protein CutA [Myxococcota bacterium]